MRQLRLLQGVEHGAARRCRAVSAHSWSSVALDEVAHLVDVGPQVALAPGRRSPRRAAPSASTSGPGWPTNRRRSQVKWPEVGLVEVVDVEDQPALARPCTCRSSRRAGRPGSRPGRRARPPSGSSAPRHVGVEEAGAAPVEGQRVSGHLAELDPERVRVGVHQARRRRRQGCRRSASCGGRRPSRWSAGCWRWWAPRALALSGRPAHARRAVRRGAEECGCSARPGRGRSRGDDSPPHRDRLRAGRRPRPRRRRRRPHVGRHP